MRATQRGLLNHFGQTSKAAANATNDANASLVISSEPPAGFFESRMPTTPWVTEVSDTSTQLPPEPPLYEDSALLSHRLGEQNVTSIELDPDVTARARTALTAVGLVPEVVCGDGSRGWAVRALFDRIEATCSVTRAPGAWVEQTKPGGVILTPWDNPWVCWGLLRLTVGENGIAEGMFSPHSAFMLMRGQRTDLRIYRDVVRDEHVPDESHTDLPAHEIAEDRWDLAFTIGMRLGSVWQAWDEDPNVEGVDRRLWLATTDTRSWAAVDHCGPDTPGFTVWQYGERKLWDELAAAHAWWLANGEPGPERFGATVDATGEHTFWLHSPNSPVTAGSAGRPTTG